MSDGGVIDYGYIRLGNFSDNNELGQKSLPVTINCDVATKLGFRMQDNHADSNSNIAVPIKGGTVSTGSYRYYNYGIGKTTDGVNIGNYGLWISNSVADGNNVDNILRNDNWSSNHPWSKSAIPRSDSFSLSTVAATGTLEPIAFTTYTFDININAMIKDTTTLAITDDTPIDGQATMTLVYL